MVLPVRLVSVLILTATIVICEGIVYMPTIIKACVHRDDESTRLNVWWRFEGTVDLSRIEGFTITFTSLNGRNNLLYQYQPGLSDGIDTDGKTYVRNIVFNVDRNDTMIAVRMITVNNTIHPESPLFKVQQCGSQDTTTTVTTASSSSSTPSTSTLLLSPSTSSSFTPLIIPSTSSTLSTMPTFHKVSSTTINITPLPSSASPTIVSACVYQADDGLFKLNVQWEFENAIDISKIEGYTIVSERRVVYHYDDDRNSTIETDGKTYVRKIPLFNISNIRRVSVYITINNIVHPQSKPVTIERCAPQDITTTSVSTVTDTPISSISISSSSTIVSTSLISSTQEIMPTSSNAVPKDRPTGIQLYIPTITSACIHRTNGTNRLNVQWKFDEATDLSEIDEFIIYYMNSSMPVKVYNYPDDSNTDVIIVGKTSASNIPLPDVISTTIQVLVASVANRAVNPTSEIFNTTECNTEELNPTATTTTTTTTTPVTTSPVTTTTVTSAVPTFTGNEQTALESKLPTSSTLPLSTLPPTLISSSPTSLSNMSSSNESDDFPIIAIVIAVAIICVLLLFIMVVLIIFIIRLKYKSCKNKGSESEAESVKPLQNGSLLFRQADKVNYLKTPSQIIDSQYITVQQQSDSNANASNQSQRYSEAHKYDVPANNRVANNRVANNDYDHIDFQYEQADHPFQQSYTNGGPHVTNYEEGPQQKYNVLVHSSSMDKLGKDCPNPPSITTEHYNKLHDNNCANTSQTHLGNGEAYYSVPVNSTLSTNNATATENPHDYDRLSEKP